MHRAVAVLGLSAQLAHAAVIPAGDYAVDPRRTHVEFRLEVMGMFPMRGAFEGATGSLSFDPRHPENAALTVDVPVGHVAGGAASLGAELQSPAWLNAAAYPDMRFTSTAVRFLSPEEVEVAGVLTLHGVARTLTLHAHLAAAARDPASGAAEISFDAEGLLRRSAFGVRAMPLLVSDDVRLILRAAFAQAR